MSTENQQQSISLQKGERVDLSKSNPSLANAGVGLGWDVNSAQGGEAFDLDASVLLLNASGKLRSEKDIIYFRNLKGQGVEHSGDNLTGEGDGDDEVISVDLAALEPEVDSALFLVNIYQAKERKQNFGMVNNAFIRIFDKSDNRQIMKFDLSEDKSTSTGMIMGKLYRKDGEWKFQAIGEEANGDLNEICKPYFA